MGGKTTKLDSVVLITGCTDGGIGASMASEFARVGCQVVATSRSLDSMKKLGALDNIHLRELDVTNYEAAKASVASVVAELGQIDILVNNAGVPCVGPVAELPLSTLESTFRTNVFGPMVLVQAVVPHMVARGKGRIVNVGSIVSYAHSPLAGGYVGSKAAMEALTDALRMELRPFGINVLLILPGAIISNIGKASVARAPDDLKLYKAFAPAIQKRASMSQTSRSTTSEEFARKVVPKILSRSPPAHYAYGRYSTIFSFLYYVPLGIRDYLWMKVFGLDVKVSLPDKKTV